VIGRSWKSRAREWLGTGLFVVVAVAVLHFVNAPRVKTLSGELPAFTAQTANGTTLRSEDLKGKVTLLNFWSPG
jgi:hypothetical protein